MNNNDTRFWENSLKERIEENKKLTQLIASKQYEQWFQYHKSILLISSGSLVVSFTWIVEKDVIIDSYLFFIVVSWALFILCIVSVIVSQIFSSLAMGDEMLSYKYTNEYIKHVLCKKEVESKDCKAMNEKRIKQQKDFEKTIKHNAIINILSLTSMVSGLIFLSIYVMCTITVNNNETESLSTKAGDQSEVNSIETNNKNLEMLFGDNPKIRKEFETSTSDKKAK